MVRCLTPDGPGAVWGFKNLNDPDRIIYCVRLSDGRDVDYPKGHVSVDPMDAGEMP